MTLTKAFAIYAEPPVIWASLWSDLASGDSHSFHVEASNWPNTLAIRLELGGMPVVLTYRIEKKQEFSETSVTLEPQSVRFGFYQFLTFGHFGRNFAMLLVEGLSNLKQAVEGEQLPHVSHPGEPS